MAKLAERLGLTRESWEFERVWAHLGAEGWTVDEVARTPREALGAARKHLQVIRAAEPGRRRQGRTSSGGWREYAAALEARAADLARQEPAVLAFRRDVLKGRLIEPSAVRGWLRRHENQRDGVAALAAQLAEAHTWDRRHALVFLLTDRTPPRPPLRVEVEIRIGGNVPPRIRVEADSWVPPEQVAAAFRNRRARLEIRDRRARALSPRAVALVAFIDRTPGTWAERMAAWNAEQPRAWRYGHRANLRRDYEAARRRLDLAPEFIGA